MAEALNRTADTSQPTIYQIRVKGHLGPQWEDWFGGLTVTLEDNGETLLTALSQMAYKNLSPMMA